MVDVIEACTVVEHCAGFPFCDSPFFEVPPKVADDVTLSTEAMEGCSVLTTSTNVIVLTKKLQSVDKSVDMLFVAIEVSRELRRR